VAFLRFLRFLRRTIVSKPWVSDFSRPKVVYTNRYTNPPRTAVNKEVYPI
jgi:hypothetical protein